SPRWKDMHGFQETEVLETTEGWSLRIHPEDRERVIGQLQDYLAGRHPEYWEEYRIRRNDGRVIWVLDRGVAQQNEQGRTVRMVGSETDITWRKEAEETIRRRAHEFRTLADNVPALFSYIDRNRRYRFVNKRYEAFFGRSVEEMAGMSVRELIGPESYAEMQVQLDSAFSGKAVSHEVRLPMSKESDRWLSVQYVPDRNQEGTVVGLFILAAEVTPLKLSEAALHEREEQLRDLSDKLLLAQEDERRRLARDLHDDFAQRLAALTLDLHNLYLLASESTPVLSSRLKTVGNTTEQLATDLQRVAHRLHPSILEHAGLEAAVREYVEEFAAQTGLTVEILVRDVPKTIPLKEATCLYRVLQESLRNVRKHANATNVLVRLLRTDRGVGLCVHDDGSGIDHTRADRERKGLGLTSMSERVLMLKGTFRLRTKTGEGTEVHAWVPLVDVKSNE
ncbi:MAG: PAS domain-containing sensor histidine kinase, partial [Nitrospiraceae bacterium]